MYKGIYILMIGIVLTAFFSCGDGGSQRVVSGVAVQESARGFIMSSPNLSSAEALRRLSFMLDSVKNDSVAFRRVVSLLQGPLSDPNSAFRNEDLFIHLLQAEIQSRWYSNGEKMSLEHKLNLASQNRVGFPANDFIYITPDGSRKRMYDVKGAYTLLYFYNPECHACKEMKELLDSSLLLSQKIQLGQVRLLAIYTDPDEELWRKHLPENSSGWLNGRDEQEYLWKNKVYDLRAIPTLYLLDSAKKVLLKDAALGAVEEMLGR